jgi:hypothetical protein
MKNNKEFAEEIIIMDKGNSVPILESENKLLRTLLLYLDVICHIVLASTSHYLVEKMSIYMLNRYLALPIKITVF